MDINRKEFLMLALGLGVGSTAGCFVQTPPPAQPTGGGGPEPGPSDEVAEPVEEGMYPANECVDWDATGECVAWEGYKPSDEGMAPLPADECVDWSPSGECIAWAGDQPVDECVEWNPSGECIRWDSPITE